MGFPNTDKLAGDIIHDSRHSEQLARGLSYNEANAVTLEQEASRFTVDVMNNTGGWDADVFKAYQDDATTGHLPGGMKDKTTSKSRAKVLEVMSRPQKRRK